MLLDKVNIETGQNSLLTKTGNGSNSTCCYGVTDADADLWSESPVWREIHNPRISDVKIRVSSAVSDVYTMPMFNFTCPFILSCFIKTRLATMKLIILFAAMRRASCIRWWV